MGQGDAALLQGRRASVLVDAGTAFPGGDLGDRVVVPALAALGVARLDVAIATHGDLDHRGGLPAVLAALEVGELWLPFGARADPAFARVLAAAGRRGVPVRETGAGQPPRRFGDLRLSPLWPPREGAALRDNDRSLVVRAELARASVLLAGDVESTAEARLVASGARLSADVLLLPHHGSRTSSSEGFLDAVHPRVAVASAPCAGRFGMPHAQVRARARAAGVPVWWTGRDGAVLVSLAAPLSVWSWGAPRAGCGL